MGSNSILALPSVNTEPVADSRSTPEIQSASLLVTREELARMLGLSARTIKRMTSANSMPGIVRPFGRTVRYCRQTIEQWVRDGCPPARNKVKKSK